MGPFNKELESLAAEKKQIARFFRVALHCHTPQSYDWAQKAADAELNRKDRFLAAGGESLFLNDIGKQGQFDIVALTDHMKCGFAARCARSARTNQGLLVVPGMEVNFRTEPALAEVRLHLLVLLPEDCSEETFGKLLENLPEEGRRDGSEELAGTNLSTWVKKVQTLGGVCIAAHVETSRGVRYEFRQTAKDVMALEGETAGAETALADPLRNFIFSVGFDGVEIRKPAHRHHYRWVDSDGSRKELATVQGLDAHCLEAYSQTDRTTLIKMTDPGLAGLRAALAFPETRIRFPSDVKGDPSPTIVGISIEGGAGAFFSDLLVACSPNLNCVIGPRGSGKSTLVEALRYLFGYNRTLTELDAQNKLSERIRSLQQANLRESRIRVYYRTVARDLRVLEATYDEKQSYVTRVFSEDGTDLNVADVERCGDYPLRLYGWSEIETLGRDPTLQRALLDRMVAGLSVPAEKRKRALASLEESRRRIAAIANGLATAYAEGSASLLRYVEYKNEFERLDTAEVRANFSKIDAATKKKDVLEAVLANASQLERKLREILPVDLLSGVSTQTGDDVQDEWLVNAKTKPGGLSTREQNLTEHISRAVAELGQVKESVQSEIRGLEGEIASGYAAVRERFTDSPDEQRLADLRRNAKRRLDEAKKRRSAYLLAWDSLMSAIEQRWQVVQELVSATNETTGVRTAANDELSGRLTELTGSGLPIAIASKPGGDRLLFESRLEPFLRVQGTRVASGTTHAIAARLTPVEFAKHLLDGTFAEWSSKVDGISATFVGKFVEAQRWQEIDSGGDIPVLKSKGRVLDGILALQEIPWDDAVSITLNGRSVDELSPGQRSSAMLPLIALAEKAPLVIDQPEDNLDNRLVGDVLVRILAELKEHRQIIVCTHNPNIVVSGDAEQVVVLDAVGDRKGKKSCSGSIDRQDIVDNVIALMEGGREAFIVRKKRYGL